MWKKWMAGGLCAALLLGAAGCAPTAPAVSQDEDEYAEFSQVFGLTKEQRIEDFAFFEETLRENYPCWQLLERNGVDYEAILAEYREMVAGADNDFTLYVAVNSALYRLGGEGHLSVLQPEWYEDFCEAYRETEDRAHWYETLANPVSAEQYPKLLAAVNALDGVEDGGETALTEETDSVTTLVLAEGEIAYLKIDSFDSGELEDERQKISDFLQKVYEYPHLIIDISQNPGGSDRYWMELLVAPLARETLTSTNYALVRNAENTAPYLAEAFGEDELHPIDELPALPRLEAADREMATHFIENTLEVEPDGRGFDGKIWLLVGPRVYSAAEAFSVFCRDTGFATLVGEPTGGDGIGIDPVLFRLPNSGLVIRYSALYGLNPDGSGNEEYGTAPDLLSPENENRLVTALRAIREKTEPSA